MSNPLLDKIKKQIQCDGYISIHDYMQQALSDTEHGYYSRNNPIGKDGDFTTAPEISQIFGELIGIWLATQWQEINSPKDILLVELGAGRGTLMNDILRATAKIPNFHNSITINIVDIGQELIQQQKDILLNSNHFNVKIQWINSIEALPPKPILLIANEFLDALPINQYIKTKNGWCERVITLDDNDELQLDINTESIAELKAIKSDCTQQVGAIYEHCKEANHTIKYIATHIKNHGGYALFIDYGYFENHYKDSLQAVQNHKYCNILHDTGNADITYHINFAKMAEIARKNGANAYSDITQGQFLTNMGINIRAAMLKKSSNTPLSIDNDVKRLIDDNQMGQLFKCIAITQPDRLRPIGF